MNPIDAIIENVTGTPPFNLDVVAGIARFRVHQHVESICEAEHIRNLREHESWNRSLGQKFRYLKRDVRKAFARTTYTFKGVHGVADGAYEVRA